MANASFHVELNWLNEEHQHQHRGWRKGTTSLPAPSATANFWADSGVPGNFSCKSGPLSLVLMPASLEFLGTKENTGCFPLLKNVSP